MTDKKPDFPTAAHHLANARARLEAAIETDSDDYEAAVKAHDEALARFGAAPARNGADFMAKIEELARWRKVPEGEVLFGPVGAVIDGIIADADRSSALA